MSSRTTIVLNRRLIFRLHITATLVASTNTATAMIKRTICFSSPAYLSLSNEQLVVNFPNAQGLDDLSGKNTVPIEDIGLMVLDNRQLTITSSLIEALLHNNTAIVSCDSKHMPFGLLQPLTGNTVHTERLRTQVQVSKPLLNRLWQQVVRQKIMNQAANLDYQAFPVTAMKKWAADVQSADAGGHEARAAAHYWGTVFPHIDGFIRRREGLAPNNLLNYGYAILRALAARALAGAGLHPALGLFHRNKYNAYCLADDLMEPYRPYVDRIIIDLMHNGEDWEDVSYSVKLQLLEIPVCDVLILGKRSPLQVALQTTATSLWRCYSKEARQLALPVMDPALHY